MRKVFIVLILILIGTYCSVAQNWNEIFYLEEEAQFLMMANYYNEAAEIYEEIVEMAPGNANLKFKLGYCYLMTDDQKDKAIKYLEEASQNISKDFDEKNFREDFAPIETMLVLGNAYLQNNRIEEAQQAFQNYRDLLDNDDLENIKTAEHFMQMSRNAIEAKKNPVNINKESLGSKLNDKNSNTNIIISGDGQTMAYTTYGDEAIDVYIVHKKGDDWGRPKKITDQLKARFYFHTSSLSYDGKTLYLISEDNSDADIYVTYLEGNEWSKPDDLKKDVNSKFNETHATISKDNQTLYFVSDREGGKGGKDIYKSIPDKKGRWSDPELLGDHVNTEYNEESPFISPDGTRLYFSSEGHNSMGGYDVFYTEISGKSNPVNLGYPINSTHDDLNYFPLSEDAGYMAFYEPDGQGMKDLYKIEKSSNLMLRGFISSVSDEVNTDSIEFVVDLIDQKTMDTLANIEIERGTKSYNYELPQGSYFVSIENKYFKPYVSELEMTASTGKIIEHEAMLVPDIPQKTEELIAEEPVKELMKDSLTNADLAEEKALVADNKVEEEKLEPELPKVEESAPEDKIQEELIAENTNNTEPVLEVEAESVEQDEKIPDVEPEIIKTRIIPHKETIYSIQIMALRKPIDFDHFKGIDDIILTYTEDGYYRYMVGCTTSLEKARELVKSLHVLGYKDAYIRENTFVSKYSIQIMALKKPSIDLFDGKLVPLIARKGKDEFYRYSIGSYASISDAKKDLDRIRAFYTQAFIRKNDID